MALLLGIAGAVLGTQCSAEGAPPGPCPATGEATALVSTPAAPPATDTEASPPDTAIAAAPAAAPPKTAAAISAHDLIEASHDLLLVAQAERPLVGGSPAAGGDAAPPAAASPDQLAYAAVPALAAEFGTPLPPAATPEETKEPPASATGLGGPLLPALPEPSPEPEPEVELDPGPEPEPEDEPEPEAELEPEAGETSDTDAAASPLASAVRIGDSRVNVRSGPSTDEARLFGLDPGEPVMATETRDGWMKIEDAAGRVGWIDATLLAGAEAATPTDATEAATAPSDTAEAAPEDTDVRTVAGSGVSVCEQPSNTATRLFALPAGEDVTVTGNDRGWLRITDSRGRTGWAYSDFLAPRS